MSIDLRKKAEENLIDLKKKATISLSKKGLGSQKARVALALDISGSMAQLYKQGVVQAVTERLLALAMNFDDNGAADVFLFGERDHEVGEIEQSNFYQFVDREILKKYSLEFSTHYAGVIRRMVEKYYPDAITATKKGGFFGFGGKKEYAISGNNAAYRHDDPVWVLVITDGDNHDKEETRKIIRDASRLGMFFQFVGVGNERFAFLEELDDLDGRFIDNANFFKVQSLQRISDEDLYDHILDEFPSWLREAKDKQILA